MSGHTVYPAFIARLCQANIERPVSTKETKKKECVTRIFSPLGPLKSFLLNDMMQGLSEKKKIIHDLSERLVYGLQVRAVTNSNPVQL